MSAPVFAFLTKPKPWLLCQPFGEGTTIVVTPVMAVVAYEMRTLIEYVCGIPAWLEWE